MLLISPITGKFEFTAMGDWGLRTSTLQRTIDAIGTLVPDRDFALLLGDNAYPAGFRDLNDPQFSLFTDVVAGNSKLQHHMILGNHDYVGNISSEIAFSQVDSRWDLPSRYYRRLYETDGVKLCLLFIDTIEFDQPQVDWLRQQLTTAECETNTAWTIVSGHYPIWTTGNYHDSPELKAQLVPLLQEFKVPLYLCGHEHLHEVFFDGVTVQVVSGANADPRAAREFRQHEYQVWGVSGVTIAGFVRIVATTSELEVHIPSSYSLRDFITFSIPRIPIGKAMFSHINWSYTQSNRDAWIAEAHSSGTVYVKHSWVTISALIALLVLNM